MVCSAQLWHSVLWHSNRVQKKKQKNKLLREKKPEWQPQVSRKGTFPPNLQPFSHWYHDHEQGDGTLSIDRRCMWVTSVVIDKSFSTRSRAECCFSNKQKGRVCLVDTTQPHQWHYRPSCSRCNILRLCVSLALSLKMTSTEMLLKYVAGKCRTEKLISWSLSRLPSSKRGPPGTGSQLVAGLTCRNDRHAHACSIHVLHACRHTVPGKCAVRMVRRGRLEYGAITCALA